MKLPSFAKSRLRRALDKKLMASSLLFDAKYYQDEVETKTDSSLSQKKALDHYLEVGGRLGLNPSPRFDSAWYLQRYPDVKTLGLNPLVHYLRFGRDEGRLPFHGAQPSEPRGTKSGSISSLTALLWGGHEHRALPVLERYIAQDRNSEALLIKAEWEYAQGEVASACRLMQDCLPITRPHQVARCLIGLAKSYTVLGELNKLRNLVNDERYRYALSEVLPYLESNALAGFGTDNRFAPVNQLYERHGLVAVGVSDANAPIALSNLVGFVKDPEVESRPNAPLVSVVMPAFNAGSGIATAIESVLAQTWGNLELIVVDDCSTDSTSDVVVQYAERDPRVRLVVNDINVGAYPSRNRGMGLATGQYVTVHDSDDWSHPQRLEWQLKPLLEQKEIVATVSSWARVTADLRFVGSWMLTQGFIEDNFSSWLIRREVLDQIGLWDSVNVAADTEFLWRLEHHYGHQSLHRVCANVPLAFALSDDSTLTRSKATHVKTVYYGLRKIYREASSWWHRQCDFQPVMTRNRAFPAPLGNLKGESTRFDAVVVADLAQVEHACPWVDRVVRLASEGQRICLVHWPNPEGWLGRPIADEVFALCQTHRLALGHVGVAVTSKVVMLADKGLWEHRPSRTLAVEGLEEVVSLNGTAMNDVELIHRYFRQGGYELS